MIIKALILSTLLTSEPAIIAMPQTKAEKIEARKRGKRSKGDRRRGGGGLR